MKMRLIIFALFVFALSACTQYTCPTYAKVDANSKANTERVEDCQ